ncbi:uncharacterized protein LOC117326704 [Pecten maximus]|uniref:uncharacterized protein LOC117326704 n=1 Tax=Pecten maximus TaxID=6579 RepID=UPI0014581BB5|nr:uncharacterized protein LOC117326704 [Pecten maximus]
MRIRIKQARPDNLTDAIHLAVELEAYKKAEKHGNEGRSYLRTASTESTESTHSAKSEKSAMESMLSSIQEKLEKMQTDISQLQAVRKKQNRPAQQGQDAKNSTDRRCYKCQEIGHFRRDCPRLKKESKTASTGVANPVRTRTRKRSSKPSAGIGVSSAAQEAGLYINAEVQHTKVKLLVDTGATVTILSQESYEKIPEERRPKLKEVKKDIMAANGSELKVLGQGGFMIKPEGCRDVYFEAVVAKISTEGILGLDFLKSRNGLIDLKRGSLVLDDVPVDTKYEGTLGCFRVVASEKITIPGKSEMVIAGELRSPSGEHMNSESLLIEGADSFLKNDKALVARSLVCYETTVPVRLMNLQEDPQTVYPGTNIARASPVTSVIETTSSSSCAPSGELREDLHQLLQRSKEHLTPEQSNKVKSLLLAYKNLFAATDSDLGRTTVVKHKIETSDARPIKQPLRRVPAHLSPEVDRQVNDMLDRGVIQKSTSLWSSGIVLVQKKDGSL